MAGWRDRSSMAMAMCKGSVREAVIQAGTAVRCVRPLSSSSVSNGNHVSSSPTRTFEPFSFRQDQEEK